MCGKSLLCDCDCDHHQNEKYNVLGAGAWVMLEASLSQLCSGRSWRDGVSWDLLPLSCLAKNISYYRHTAYYWPDNIFNGSIARSHGRWRGFENFFDWPISQVFGHIWSLGRGCGWEGLDHIERHYMSGGTLRVSWDTLRWQRLGHNCNDTWHCNKQTTRVLREISKNPLWQQQPKKKPK